MTLADAHAVADAQLVMVRPMTAKDVAFAARLHQEALPHGFFGRLGARYLSAYYASFVASPHAVALIAEASDGPAGALVGTVANSAHYSWVLRNHGARLAVRGALALLARPSELAFFARTRVGRYLRKAARLGRGRVLRAVPPVDASQQPQTQRRPAARRRRHPAVLTHVAVTPASRGLGVGAALERAFVDAARAAGCQRAMLVTLAGDDGAGRFYRRLGWTLDQTREDRDGRLIECYRRTL